MSDAPPPPPGPYGGPLEDGSPDDGGTGTSGTAAPASAPAKSRWKAWVAAGAAAAVVVVGGVIVITRSSGSSSAESTQAGAATSAGAANSPTNGSGYGNNGGGRRPGGRGTQGTISAINGSLLTIQTSDQNGTGAAVEVKTTDSTIYTAVRAGGLGDLTVGDNVVVTGQAAADGSVGATRIADRGSLVDSTGGVPGGGFPGGGPNGGQSATNGGQGRGTGSITAGSIVSVDGSTIMVQAPDGTSVTVTTAASTMITVTSEASLSDLSVGEAVRVVGTTDGTTVTATAIQSGDLGAGFGGRVPPRANGGQMTPPTTTS